MKRQGIPKRAGRSGKMQAVAVVAMAAVVLPAGVWLAFFWKPTPPPTVAIPAPTASQTPARTPLTTTIGLGSRVLFLGDSYAAGTGADGATSSWAFRVADTLGWKPTVRGVGGTGFTWGGGTDGQDGQDYLTRLTAIAGRNLEFDAVVIEGGQNDYRATPDELDAAVDAVITKAQRAWPDAQVVVFGPTAPQPLGDMLSRLATVIASAAAGRGVYSINPVEEQWLTTANTGRFRFDDAHVNQAGHDYLARRFVKDLREFTLF